MPDSALHGIDFLFGNEPARLSSDHFVGLTTDSTHDVSISDVNRLDVWMTTLMEDLPRKKGCTQRWP